jgi:hypothetical protein
MPKKSFTGRRTINEKKYKDKKKMDESDENTTEMMKEILADSQSDINVSRQQMGMNMNMMQQQPPMNMNMMQQPPMNMMQQPPMNMNMMQNQIPMTSAGDIDPLLVNTFAPVNMNQNSMMHQQQLLNGSQMAQNMNVMSEQHPMMGMQQNSHNMMGMQQNSHPMNMTSMNMMGQDSFNINAIKNLSGLNTMKMI